ncbi:MAG TPA: GNAT family N-acetyltransferase [Bacillota bacterium]|mgnify:CR=1 FL=1|nr:GNAT family N-acetyltransferase [Bacillota bacterium]HOH10573.1 GNAT family N-acetyltransferase [Bacillota bacterium]HOY89413.1 GNAT family N-acetyltransferase [Bacillota bacterium]HPM63622.1 GNAT family N-acetyltransferase [Bacillota bacterium]
MTDVKIVQVSDIGEAEVASVFDACWQDTEPSVMMHGPQGYRRVTGWLDIEPKSSAVAYSDGKPVGVVLIGFREPDRAYVASLAVNPSFRGRGYGRRLMQWGMARARIWGCKKVGLHVFEENGKALSLYRSLGFGPVRRIGHWEGNISYMPSKALTFTNPGIEEAVSLVGLPDMPPLWENEPKSLLNLRDNVICVLAWKHGEPFGYMVYSTRSLCWVLDLNLKKGAGPDEATQLIFQLPTARFLPAVFTTVPEGGENERILRCLGLRRDRVRIEMELRLSQDGVS